MIKAATQALVLCAIFVVSATAQTWDGGGAAGGAVTWTTAANWNPDGVPVNNGTANLIMAGTIDVANTVDVNFDINGLTFNNTAGAFVIGNSGGATLTIRGGGITNQDIQSQTINAPLILGASQTWSTTSGQIIAGSTVSLGANQLILTGAITGTINGVIDGSGSLVKNGGTSWIIGGSAANTYTGLTTVNDGTLIVQKTVGNAISGNLTIGDGIGAAGSALVSLQGLNQIADNSTVTILSDGRLNVNGLSDTTGLLRMFGGSVTTGGGTLTLSDNVQIDATATTTSTISGKLNLGAATRDFQVDNGSAPTDLDISAAISNGGVTKSGPGQLQYSGSVLNTYLGMTTVNEGSLFLNKDDNVLSLPGDLTINNGATVQNGHVGQTSGNTDVAINNFGNLLVSFNATIASLSLNDGVVQNFGTAVLTVLGPITVNNSTTASVFNLGTTAQVVLAGSGSNITTASLDPGLEDLQFNGKVVSTNGLTKNGAGWLSLLGAVDNTISGTTTVNQGKLALLKDAGFTALGGDIVVGDGVGGFDADVLDLGGSHQIAHSASDTMTINSSGRFDLHIQSEGIGNLVLNAGRVTGGTISFTGSVTTSAQSTSASITSNIDLLGSTTTFTVNDGVVATDLDASGAITNGSFVKAGAGTMKLSGSTANTATVQVSGGTVILDKPAGVNALGGTEVIVGDTSGVTLTEILRYGANDHQLPDSITVTVRTVGLFDLNGRSDTIGSLNLVGGPVQTGAGTLTITNQVTSIPLAIVPTIGGNLNLAGGLRPFNVNDEAGAPIDLNVTAAMSNGTLVKQNTGTLSLSGSALTSNISYQLEAGEISANGLTIGVGRSFTTNAGTFSGALNNSGAFVYNAGTFSGQLANKLTGATTFNADFTAAGGLANEGTIAIAAGRTLTAGGTGVSNDGTFVLDGGTLTAAVSNFVNQQVITGHGQLNASGPALNNSGDIVVTGGHLLVNATLGIVSSGVISVGSGLDLQVSGGGVVQNNGLIALNGGRILGSLSITNGIGGEIRGGSSVEMPVNNVGGVIRAAGTGTLTITSLTGNSAGGELRVDDGATLLVQTPFSSSGTIVLAGANATLNGGNVTNTGTLRGAGRVNSVVTNNGTIRAENGTLTFPATGHSNPAAGRIEAGAGAQVLFSQGLATNSGMIALTGGAFDNNNIALANPGRIEGHGTLRTGGLTNSSTISVGGTLEVLGPVTQNAVVDTQAGSTTRFFSPVSGPGNYTGTGSVQFLNTFSPGASPAAVSFGGNVTFTGSATLVIEIAGTTAGSQYDTLTVAGNASLAGALDIDLLGGFIPTPGNAFQIIIASGGVSGTFGTVLLPALTGANWQLLYNPISVSLRVALLGDYNFNGTVDAADYVVWRKMQGQTGSYLLADGNGNGQIDTGDLNVWRAHFGQTGSGSGSAASVQAAIPEPATLVLLIFAMAGSCFRRGRAA